MNIHSSIIHNNQKREQSKCPSIDQRIKCGVSIQWDIIKLQKGMKELYYNMEES